MFFWQQTKTKESFGRLDDQLAYFAKQGIAVQIVKKSVKNINFRIKPNLLTISVPKWIDERQLIEALTDKQAWILASHHKLSQRPHQQMQMTLWGEPLDIDTWLDDHFVGVTHRRQLAKLDDESRRLWIYRQELAQWLPIFQQKWQPIVGKSASRLTIKKMHTRWGSCNVRTASVNMSLYLAAYPKACTEYVLVHELCHLHHADHSPNFWQTVKKAMPDYEHWHGLLRGKNMATTL